MKVEEVKEKKDEEGERRRKRKAEMKDCIPYNHVFPSANTIRINNTSISRPATSRLICTWQSSTLVFITPFMNSFSMVGDTPKLFPMHRISARPSGHVTSTEPFRITDHESS